MGNGRNGSHSKALDEICNNPEKKVGIKRRDILTISKEQKLYYRGSLLTEVDIIFELKGQRVIFVEYKSTDESDLIRTGRDQLQRAITFYRNSLKREGRGILFVGEEILQEGDRDYFRKGYKLNKNSNHCNKRPFYLNGKK